MWSYLVPTFCWWSNTMMKTQLRANCLFWKDFLLLYESSNFFHHLFLASFGVWVPMFAPPHRSMSFEKRCHPRGLACSPAGSPAAHPSSLNPPPSVRPSYESLGWPDITARCKEHIHPHLCRVLYFHTEGKCSQPYNLNKWGKKNPPPRNTDKSMLKKSRKRILQRMVKPTHVGVKISGNLKVTIFHLRNFR